MADKVTKLAKAMEKELKYTRYLHTMGVAFTATSLAMRYGEDLERAEISGLLHDCAKCLGDSKLISICKSHDVKVTEVEKAKPSLLHAKAGAVIANEEYNISDEQILDAIRYHTTGRPGMTMLETIVFISDYIEPGRQEAPHLDELRRLAFENIDEALLLILEDTISYLNKSGGPIDPMTQKTYDYYAKLYKKMV